MPYGHARRKRVNYICKLSFSSTQRGFMGTIAGDYNRQHSVNRRKSPAIAGDHAEAYRRVMSTWPSLMVGTAEGDLPKLLSLNKGELSLIFIQRHRLDYFNHTHAHARAHAKSQTRAHARASTRICMHAHAYAQTRAHAQARTSRRTRARKQARARTHTRVRACTRTRASASTRARVHARARACVCACLRRACARVCVRTFARVCVIKVV